MMYYILMMCLLVSGNTVSVYEEASTHSTTGTSEC